MSETLVEMRNLKKSFPSMGGDVEVLKGVDFTLNRGEFIAIEGRSGSGKSTLLSIIGLLDLPSTGEYELCGQQVMELSTYQQSILRNRNIGWIFQNFNLIGDMTVSENLALPLRYNHDISRSQFTEKIHDVLDKVELSNTYGQYPGQLSGGQQQRVAIARALITEPDLILADEPTGNLDSESTDIILGLLHKLHSDGASIILITHDAELALHSERQYYLQDGLFIGKIEKSQVI